MRGSVSLFYQAVESVRSIAGTGCVVWGLGLSLVAACWWAVGLCSLLGQLAYRATLRFAHSVRHQPPAGGLYARAWEGSGREAHHPLSRQQG